MRCALFLLAAAFTIAAAGCAQNTDASDPDPHYYKGKAFIHKKTM
jgi:hypothetical protein